MDIVHRFLMDLREKAREKRQLLEKTPCTPPRALEQAQAVEAYLVGSDAFDGSDVLREKAVLHFLGFSEADIRLLKKAVMLCEEPAAPVRRGRLRYWEDGKWCMTPIMDLDPEHEEYYQFDLYGIFKIVDRTKFYSLTENGWERDGDAMRRYYDVQYDYGKISYELVEGTPVPEKYCPVCRQPAKQGYVFCSSCGADMGLRYCRHCKKKLPEDALFCPYCGKKQ